MNFLTFLKFVKCAMMRPVTVLLSENGVLSKLVFRTVSMCIFGELVLISVYLMTRDRFILSL